ncbi:MAG: SWIM zinc finger family protein [Chloroflexi bacterium]|nr:SWIM zinc finger family protein [Chloroflexota bacterium]
MERLVDAARLGRGRSYARGGKVRSIDVQPGVVKARVQGSRPQPYRVEIRLPALGHAEWERVLDALASQAIFAAKLLAEEMPPTVEEAFAAAGVSLFPRQTEDLETDCSCPDWANPCKHVAAVHYLLGAEFDRDPFLLFRLRGLTKDEVMAALRARRTAAAPAEPAGRSDEAATPETAEAAGSSLDDDLERFWVAGEGLAHFPVHLAPPDVQAAVLKRLGAPALPASARMSGYNERDLLRALESAYAVVSARALALAYGDD